MQCTAYPAVQKNHYFLILCTKSGVSKWQDKNFTLNLVLPTVKSSNISLCRCPTDVPTEITECTIFEYCRPILKINKKQY